MKETVSISIAGIGFIFDEDAYATLKEYLDRIARDYADHPDGKEIIDDIEARIVEIILSEQPAENVVSDGLIKGVVERMGYPEDQATERDGEQVKPERPEQTFPKRLYRNKDGAKLGGVFSGLATFFRADVVWFRLAFFVPLSVMIVCLLIDEGDDAGVSLAVQFIFVILYILMWIVVPLARTPRQMLEMYGKEITTSAIEGRMKRDLEVMPRGAARSSSIFSDIVSVIGRIIVVLFKAALCVVGVLAGLFVIASIVGIMYAVFNWGAIKAVNWDYVHWMELDLNGVMPVGIAAVLSLMFPALLVAIGAFSFLFKSRANRIVIWSLVGMWLLSLGFVTAKAPAVVRSAYMKTEVGNTLDQLVRAGYYVQRDKAGNVTLPGDTLLYAGEEVTTAVFYKRVAAELRPEVDIRFTDNIFVGGHIYMADKKLGPQLYESHKAKAAAEGKAMNMSFDEWYEYNDLLAKRDAAGKKRKSAEETVKRAEDKVAKAVKDEKDGDEVEKLKREAARAREGYEAVDRKYSELKRLCEEKKAAADRREAGGEHSAETSDVRP